MLRYISIENFTLIDRLELEFRDGLNLITGETGSGKSILVDAVGLLVGDRASQEMIREGHDCSRIEGLFEVDEQGALADLLDRQGIETSRELLVRREVSRNGNNRVFINNRLATVGQLSEIGEFLVDIHGQHSQQTLLRASAHLDYLDQFGALLARRREVAALFHDLHAVRRDLSERRQSERDRLQRLDLIRYQLEEIERLRLRPGLDRELQEERDLLASSEKRFRAARQSYQQLYEQEDSLVSLLDRAESDLSELGRLDDSQSEPVTRLREARFQVEEIALQMRDYSESIQFDPALLEEIEARLSELDRARRKYGGSVDDILAYQAEIESELNRLESHEEEMSRLEEKEARLVEDYRAAAEDLSGRRSRASLRLSGAVERELAELAMGGTTFEVKLTPLEADAASGKDHAEFLISPNPGEPPKALSRIASGGELSRVMLALKSVLKGRDASKTFVFDEVDAGIGGRTAATLGEKLARVAARAQVFCVTHLPQIAAFASQHFHVDKKMRGGRTIIQVTSLDEQGRVEELGRMLAGEKITETTRRQARELLTTGQTAPGL